MDGEVMRTAVAIVTAIIGLAILSVLVSKNATTMGLVQNLSVGLATDINAATAPVTNAGGLGGMNNLQFAQSGVSY
jgi:hypothetical protein